MSKRLVEVATELNVGTKTIVEYLRNQGFEISDKPIAKISTEMYDALVKNFQKTIAIKQKAEEMDTRKKEEKPKEKIKPWERPSLVNKEPKIFNKTTEDGQNNPIAVVESKVEKTIETTPLPEVTNIVAPEQTTTPTTDEVKTVVTTNETIETPETNKDNSFIKTETHTLKGPKILGKINLDEKKPFTSNNQQNNTNQNKNQQNQNREKKQETNNENRNKTNTNNNNNENRNRTNNNNEKRNKTNTNNNNNENRNKNNGNNNNNENRNRNEKNQQPQNLQNKEKKQENQPKTTIEKIVTPITTDEVKNENQEPVVTTDATIDPSNENEIERIQAPQLKGLKILGKITLETKPKKRKRKDKREGSSSNTTNTTTTNTGNQQPREGGEQKREPRNNNNNNQQSGNNNNSNSNRHREGRENNQSRGNNNRNTETTPKVVIPNPNTTTDASGNLVFVNNTGKPLLHKPKNSPPTKEIVTSEGGKTGSNSSEDAKRKRKRTNLKEKTTTGTVLTEEQKRARGKLGEKGGKKKEITSREIDETIKATMARVQSGGKKKKIGTTRSERAERKEQIRIQSEEGEEQLPLQVTEFISVSELANLMDVPATEVIMACMGLGIFVSINQRLDADVIELVAGEFDFKVEFISAEEQIELDEEEEEDNEKDLQPRAPIVTVMGHVDHGKTSLLDYIRKANVASGEAGGITQHIGAYEVAVPNKGKITFLDTPGHEAFTAMRARGAKVTDIAVIIIAADDNIMPQTKEAISHAQAAGVPIIFAINKIDKEGAAPEKIKQELASMNFLVEDWGGKYQSQDISAKKGLNVDLLLEKILLEAEMLNLKGNPVRRAVGTVLEASLEKGRGYVAKILVQTGTLHVGDPIVAGQYSGKVKAMFNERGKAVKVAGPSTPVLVLGLEGAPQAGEKLKVMTSERDAKELASKRAQIARQQQIRATKRITLDDITRRLKVGNFKELNLIVKGDMDGSVEALSDSLLKLSTEQVQTRIVHKAVGPVTESDILLASASDAIVVGFQVRPNLNAKRLAEQEGVQIKTYSIIYDAINEVKAALEGLLQPKQVEQELGTVEIREVYKITKIGTVAGCFVMDGKITRNSLIRIVRNGIIVYPNKEGAQGELGSLKRFKDSVMEVKSGFECGLTIKNFDAIQVGDSIEAYEIVEVKQKLDDLKKLKS